MPDLELVQDFCSAYGSSWDFACTKVQHRTKLEKSPGRKRLGSSMKSWLFFRNFTHMLHFTCHSTCPLPQRILHSKRTSRLYESLQNTCAALILSKAILLILMSPAARKSRFFMKFRHLALATGATMQTLVPFILFPQPMDRAEVLHAQNYDIEDRRKNTPNEND